MSELVRVDTAQPADPFDREAVADLRHTRTLRESYAKVFRRAMLAQVAVADLIFIVYAWAGKHWKVDAAVMDVWLSATVVQVISIVAIITRSLFPADPAKRGVVAASGGSRRRG